MLFRMPLGFVAFSDTLLWGAIAGGREEGDGLEEAAKLTALPVAFTLLEDFTGPGAGAVAERCSGFVPWADVDGTDDSWLGLAASLP